MNQSDNRRDWLCKKNGKPNAFQPAMCIAAHSGDVDDAACSLQLLAGLSEDRRSCGFFMSDAMSARYWAVLAGKNVLPPTGRLVGCTRFVGPGLCRSNLALSADRSGLLSCFDGERIAKASALTKAIGRSLRLSVTRFKAHIARWLQWAKQCKATQCIDRLSYRWQSGPDFANVPSTAASRHGQISLLRRLNCRIVYTERACCHVAAMVEAA